MKYPSIKKICDGYKQGFLCFRDKAIIPWDVYIMIIKNLKEKSVPFYFGGFIDCDKKKYEPVVVGVYSSDILETDFENLKSLKSLTIKILDISISFAIFKQLCTLSHQWGFTFELGMIYDRSATLLQVFSFELLSINGFHKSHLKNVYLDIVDYHKLSTQKKSIVEKLRCECGFIFG